MTPGCAWNQSQSGVSSNGTEYRNKELHNEFFRGYEAEIGLSYSESPLELDV